MINWSSWTSLHTMSLRTAAVLATCRFEIIMRLRRTNELMLLKLNT